MNEQLKPFQQVLVRGGEDEVWRIDLYEQYNTNLHHPYVTMCGIYDHCIPYEGNEHLLGTTDSPQSKRWRAKKGEQYWYLNYACECFEANDDRRFYDDNCYNIGNYFRTREEAEEMADRIKAMLKREENYE